LNGNNIFEVLDSLVSVENVEKPKVREVREFLSVLLCVFSVENGMKKC